MAICFQLRATALLAMALTLTGCGGKETILPQDGPTMLDLYQRRAGTQNAVPLREARAMLRRPLNDDTLEVNAFARDAIASLEMRFKRLPNPDLVMFTFPHLTTLDQAPIPGYMTVFPMYERTHYAMPGETTE